jgi:hypothetical protein
MHFKLRSLVIVPVVCLFATGCHVTEHNDGDKENVEIGTPFGSMHVKTNNGTDTSAIGITAYPGAVPVKQDDDKDTNTADVDMSFGSFHLGVKAASFQTPDQPDKVVAFYRKDLAHFGDVIECQDNKPVGLPTRTSQGLSCDSKGQSHVHLDSSKNGVFIGSGSSGSNLELRVGSEQHQHIVGVEQKNGGTKIGLVSLDLPSHLSDHDRKDSE